MPRLLPGKPQEAGQVIAMIDDKEPLVRKYGAILARRLYDESPELLQKAALSEDPEIRKFAEDEIEMCSD